MKYPSCGAMFYQCAKDRTPVGAVNDACFKTTSVIMEDPMFKHSMEAARFTECAIWGRLHEDAPLHTTAFIARGTITLFGTETEVLLSCQFVPKMKLPVRLACSYGQEAVGLIARFLCVIEENLKIVEVAPTKKTIWAGDWQRGCGGHTRDDGSVEDYKCQLTSEPTWQPIRDAYTLQEMIKAVTENLVVEKGYNALANNCRTFSWHLYNELTTGSAPRLRGTPSSLPRTPPLSLPLTQI